MLCPYTGQPNVIWPSSAARLDRAFQTECPLTVPPRPVSARERAEKKLFAFAFARLMDGDGATISDGGHQLCVYRCDDRNRLLVRELNRLPGPNKGLLVLAELLCHTFVEAVGADSRSVGGTLDLFRPLVYANASV